MNTQDGTLHPSPEAAIAAGADPLFVMPIDPTPAQIRRMKVGRNEPCPCGSGLKFKRCCLGKPVTPAPTATEKNDDEDGDVERVARILARTYIVAFRSGVEQKTGPMDWRPGLEESINLQWGMFLHEAREVVDGNPLRAELARMVIERENWKGAAAFHDQAAREEARDHDDTSEELDALRARVAEQYAKGYDDKRREAEKDAVALRAQIENWKSGCDHQRDRAEQAEQRVAELEDESNKFPWELVGKAKRLEQRVAELEKEKQDAQQILHVNAEEIDLLTKRVAELEAAFATVRDTAIAMKDAMLPKIGTECARQISVLFYEAPERLRALSCEILARSESATPDVSALLATTPPVSQQMIDRLTKAAQAVDAEESATPSKHPDTDRLAYVFAHFGAFGMRTGEGFAEFVERIDVAREQGGVS